MPQDNQRKPSVPREVEDIQPERDARVRVLGTVLEKRDDSLVLDDGTGTVEAFVDADDLKEVKEGQRIRVFGRVLPTTDSFELQGELVQEMTDLDMDSYGQVKDEVGKGNIP
ncbi:MAG: OB-fold nucleic acid binding domain-containing protein [Candidatus Nanohaloarchaeota archaeon QJJ-7]|nr:OB-fold nucleic acid binding domain-containing protein [Candidatus Nanohaloarchaeota archaeon QJJ-7]